MSKTILFAVDTTGHTVAAADLARDLAAGTGERVVTEIVERLRGSGVTAQADIRKTPVGHIARAISAAADEMDARMIVLGSTSTHDVPRLPFGSVSLRLLHLATRPVLIVPKAPAPAREHAAVTTVTSVTAAVAALAATS